MLLSEAIIAGSRITDKCQDIYIVRNSDGNYVRSCALGAAMIATGRVTSTGVISLPVRRELQKMISDMNDGKAQPPQRREDIAQWLIDTKQDCEI